MATQKVTLYTTLGNEDVACHFDIDDEGGIYELQIMFKTVDVVGLLEPKEYDNFLKKLLALYEEQCKALAD